MIRGSTPNSMKVYIDTTKYFCHNYHVSREKEVPDPRPKLAELTQITDLAEHWKLEYLRFLGMKMTHVLWTY